MDLLQISTKHRDDPSSRDLISVMNKNYGLLNFGKTRQLKDLHGFKHPTAEVKRNSQTSAVAACQDYPMNKMG